MKIRMNDLVGYSGDLFIQTLSSFMPLFTAEESCFFFPPHLFLFFPLFFFSFFNQEIRSILFLGNFLDFEAFSRWWMK